MSKALHILGLISVVFAASLARSWADTAPALPDGVWLIPYGDSEFRVDLNGDGIPDSFFTGPVNGKCDFQLLDLKTRSLKWTAHFPDQCITWVNGPMWHYRSFMGDSSRDFTIVVQVPITPNNPLGYVLYAGDGATGQVRDYELTMGNAQRASIVRVRGIQTVDFRIPGYPGPALLVRNNGGGNDEHGHLIYFPGGSNGAIDLTTNPAVINAALFQGYPFPGDDIPVPLADPNGPNIYTSIYNSFNSDLVACQPLLYPSEGVNQCGSPDGGSPGPGSTWNQGNGEFLDQVAVGDMDGDGVDDAVMTYEWRSIVYPGRPKGRVDLLGAPQYDNYYNPQNDGGGCHGGRHYGFTGLIQTPASSLLKTMNIAGLPVGSFADVSQGVSRNIAVIDMKANASLPTFDRPLLWNLPMHTLIPNCDITNLFANSMHVPADGMLRDTAGHVVFLQVNRWTQETPAGVTCQQSFACQQDTLKIMTGYWSWEAYDVQTGALSPSHAIKNMYVWDTLPGPQPGTVWLLYSSNTDRWDLQTTAVDSTTKLYRDDLKISLLNTATFALSQTQTLPPSTPDLKYSYWQQVGGAVSSNYFMYRLWTSPVSGSATPGFLLDTPTGFSFFALSGSGWNEIARYGPTGLPFDTTPPVISALSASGITPTSAVITWTTDENSDSQVDYGGTASYGLTSGLDASPATAHSVTLTGLTSNTLYHYRVKSKDAVGNLGSSTPDATFTTASTIPHINSVTLDCPATGCRTDGTPYTIVMTATDPGGGGKIYNQYVAINVRGDNGGQFRGYLLYYPSDYWSTVSGYEDDHLCTGNGAGYAAIGLGYGDPYIHLDSCVNSISGNTRTTTFTVRWDPAFAVDGPLTNNDIAGYVYNLDGRIADNADTTGWANFDLNFRLYIPTTPHVDSVTIDCPAGTCKTDGTPYTLTIVGSDPGGGDKITHEYALTNWQGPNANAQRGYLVMYYPYDYWSSVPDQVKDHRACVGGGWAAVILGYGDTAIHLDSCSVSTSGTVRTTLFHVRFDPTFTTPLTGNHISGLTYNSDVHQDGWTDFPGFDLPREPSGAGMPDIDVSGINGKTYTLHDTIALTYSGSATGFNWEFDPRDTGQVAAGVGAPGHVASAPVGTTAPRFNLATLPLLPGPYTLRVQAVNGSQTSAWATAGITLVGSDLAGVVVSPNPWKADRHAGHPITFDHLTANATIKIFTVSGHWVTTLPASSATATWDLKNDSGNTVASGLYLYLITTPDRQKKTGQLSVIR